MSLKSLQEIQQFVDSYLQGTWPPVHAARSQVLVSETYADKRAGLVASELMSFITKQKPTVCIRVFTYVSQLLQHRNANADVNQRQQQLKSCLKKYASGKNWKNTLLRTNTRSIFSFFYTPIEYDNNAEQLVLLTPNRFILAEESSSAAFVGIFLRSYDTQVL